MHKWTWVALALVAGCVREALPPEPEGQAARYGSCVRRGERCRVGGTACCSGFCSDFGYGTGECTAPLDDGEFCTADAQCRAGVCTSYRCGAPACEADGAECAASAECCSGFCEIGYVTGRCAPPQPAGAWCTSDGECESHVCYDYRCAAPGCFPDGGKCWSGSSCCSGFCEWVGYADGRCAAPQPPGAFCASDADCQSRVCGDDYVCK